MNQFQQNEDENVVTAEPEVASIEPAEADTESAVPATESGQAQITVKRGGVATEEVFLFAPPAVIGRFDPSVGPVDIDLGGLPEGAYVSRKHAKISCEDGIWKLTDLGSSNGTYLLRDDFEKIDEAELQDGSEFALGNARFVFHLGTQN